jgi:hypothetical protein
MLENSVSKEATYNAAVKILLLIFPFALLFRCVYFFNNNIRSISSMLYLKTSELECRSSLRNWDTEIYITKGTFCGEEVKKFL